MCRPAQASQGQASSAGNRVRRDAPVAGGDRRHPGCRSQGHGQVGGRRLRPPGRPSAAGRPPDEADPKRRTLNHPCRHPHDVMQREAPRSGSSSDDAAVLMFAAVPAAPLSEKAFSRCERAFRDLARMTAPDISSWPSWVRRWHRLRLRPRRRRACGLPCGPVACRGGAGRTGHADRGSCRGIMDGSVVWRARATVFAALSPEVKASWRLSGSRRRSPDPLTRARSRAPIEAPRQRLPGRVADETVVGPTLERRRRRRKRFKRLPVVRSWPGRPGTWFRCRRRR